MFVNPQVTPDSLPQAEGLTWQPLHPRFARRLQAGALLWIAVVATLGALAQLMLATAGGGASPWLPSAAWTVFAGLAVRALVWPLIAVPRQGYVVRDKDILYKSGVLWLVVKAVPFNRVQHTRIDSGPLDRRFGLANLCIFPAGVGSHRIRGLGADAAEQLRAYVSARIEAETGKASDTDC